MIATLRRSAAALVLLAALAACGGTDADAAGGMSVEVTAPAADATVEVPFDVELTASVPLGTTGSGRHHVHVWFDDNAGDYQVVEAPTVRVDELPAGPHVLHASLRNANHSPAGAETQVRIMVGGTDGKAPTPADEPDPYGY
ncbi:hypothetical protein [Asanoa iriomotensis]|uniref:DUF4399 domain-containing protein n=1 Tax=Asanoa iriomotensis TaxID=234613 RepID=A0ABQ4BTR6_9ACTN|nr:hypothetical protein [Asanoa iriomotensis]GIF53912.1 hypothetical protein Air01nite_00070 [Asanoa iriomotensis]